MLTVTMLCTNLGHGTLSQDDSPSRSHEHSILLPTCPRVSPAFPALSVQLNACTSLAF